MLGKKYIIYPCRLERNVIEQIGVHVFYFLVKNIWSWCMLDKENKGLRARGMHLRDKDEKLFEGYFCSGWTKSQDHLNLKTTEIHLVPNSQYLTFLFFQPVFVKHACSWHQSGYTLSKSFRWKWKHLENSFC